MRINRGMYWLVLALALSAVTGCSVARFGYNQANHLTYWWLDGFVDFNDAQKLRTRESLTQWFAWHRRAHLPEYANLLARAQNLSLEDITAERTCGLWKEVRGYMDAAFEHAVPMTTEIMLTLTPQQIQNIERRYAKSNEEFHDENLKGDASQRLKKSIKRTVERAEHVYGKLDNTQHELITRLATLSPYDANIWNTERQRRQQDFVQLLRRLSADGTSQDKAQAALRAYIERIHRSPNDEYRRYAAQLSRYNCAFVADLHNITSSAQRKNAAGKFKGWESDIRALLPSVETAGLGPVVP
ncbi:hypothetical protein SAMN05216420_102234 [Nitrosospira sp. Nl5]|uniref:DUF6279 family lipoprotein n=1 Tax=Nitrosospira sp. Nl5 TaxID=200120 RepID=UPI00087F7DD1|nr:DUF6279 family lipoprotein [Nitrosospira sp. Nl5]SCY08335.1 hypothetical protein SAMN05216420_102234 [Nitrosospira sp. Nl5]